MEATESPSPPRHILTRQASQSLLIDPALQRNPLNHKDNPNPSISDATALPPANTQVSPSSCPAISEQVSAGPSSPAIQTRAPSLPNAESPTTAGRCNPSLPRATRQMLQNKSNNCTD